MLTRLRPRDAEALNNLAQVLLAQGDGGALAVAEEALAAAPQTAHVMGTAGWAAVQAGQVERGVLLLRTAVSREPGNADTRVLLASALARQGQQASARAELDKALEGAGPVATAREAARLRQQLP